MLSFPCGVPEWMGVVGCAAVGVPLPVHAAGLSGVPQEILFTSFPGVVGPGELFSILKKNDSLTERQEMKFSVCWAKLI